MKTLQLAVVALGLSFASQASAEYIFTCYPPTDHFIGPRAPNVLMMLDMSGSMSVSTGEDVDADGNPDSRYKVARLAITDVANSTYDPGPCPDDCDSVRLGLGYYPSSENLGAASAVTVGEDTAASIGSWLNTNSPGGGTPTGDAANFIAATMQLQDTTRPNVAVLITDGEPSATGEAAALAQGRNAITKACEARNRADAPVTTYVLGFGSGSNEQVNSATAAAGGTGQCCSGATAPCDTAFEVDPCVVGANAIIANVNSGPGGYYVQNLGAGYSCTGSLEATGSDIKDQLLAILAETSCIFPLDIPADYPGTGADPNPDATEVKIWHSLYGSAIPIPPVGEGDTLPDYLEDVLGVAEDDADDYEDEGWEFTGASRKFVRLSERLCQDVQTNRVSKVTTEIACVCTLAGQPCTFNVGTFTPTQLERMRCGQGIYECQGSLDVCVANSGAMPETCNGLDDDCDGTTDNMSESWALPEYTSITLPDDRKGIDCLRRDVCMCPIGERDNHAGTTLATYFEEWSPVCSCGEGLE